MSFFRDLKNLLTTGSRAPTEDGRSGDRAVDNADAEAPAASLNALQSPSAAAPPGYSPGYVNTYDEGRPRK